MGEWLVYSMQISFILTCFNSNKLRHKLVADMLFFDFSGNNARIIGSHSGIIGQFCENRGIEL